LSNDEHSLSFTGLAWILNAGSGPLMMPAAEWIMMIHNMFVAEDGYNLILLRGIPQK